MRENVVNQDLTPLIPYLTDEPVIVAVNVEDNKSFNIVGAPELLFDVSNAFPA